MDHYIFENVVININIQRDPFKDTTILSIIFGLKLIINCKCFIKQEQPQQRPYAMNTAKRYSGICIDYPTSITSSFCTFSNNKVSQSRCVSISSSSGIISISFANIVHNNSPSNGVVYVSEAGARIMMYCIFQNNQDFLFCVSSGSLEISHSFIDHSESSFSTSIEVSTSNNNSMTNRITYQIQFFNSLHCNADIPLPQRTLENSVVRSLEETITRTKEETLRMTNERTIRATLINTLNETPMNTHEETLLNTREETPMNTLEETLMNTREETLMNTREETLINTHEETLMNTLEETPMYKSLSANSFRIVFVSLSIVVLIV